MAEPSIIIELTEKQRRAIIGALHDKLGETEHYLLSYRYEGDEPGELDTCCDAHLSRYKERINQRDALRERKALVEQVIKIVDTTELNTWQNTVPRELASVLHDREDDRSEQAARWLAEHENDYEVWNLIGKLLDRLTDMAANA